MKQQQELRTEAWLLKGISSLPGILTFADGRLSFMAFGSGSFWRGQLRKLEAAARRPGLAKLLEEDQKSVVFDVDLSEVRDIDFPWFYFTGGVKLTVNGVRYRFGFSRPANSRVTPDLADSMRDVAKARQSGAAWKSILLPSDTTGSGRRNQEQP